MRKSKRQNLWVQLYAHDEFLTDDILKRGGKITLDRVESGNSYRRMLFDTVKAVGAYGAVIGIRSKLIGPR